eukprot:3005028-Amphidinium_carterae.1
MASSLFGLQFLLWITITTRNLPNRAVRSRWWEDAKSLGMLHSLCICPLWMAAAASKMKMVRMSLASAGQTLDSNKKWTGRTHIQTISVTPSQMLLFAYDLSNAGI